ncbi:DUF4249 domain-containing protein [Lewinella sp. 4G2]|uniref:DUF4249 domain-containing protein n=1 Tax=Lewinella sp. 4G2 TaxID=1803372 RepID=UPI0007B462CB|nr:DUF4249 domain-containing protein [Lewinella sp. 4G2]OAV43616.1 hypothetical protein A3850_003495 [Lewinella sp. 4G2]
MKILSFFTFALLLITISSCGDDPFSTTVEIDFPEHEPLPVFTLDVRAGDTSLYSRVALSRGLLEDPMPISDRPRVTFLRDGEVVVSSEIELSSTDGDNFEYRLPTAIPGTKSTYRVEVDFPGYEQASAEQTMPTAPVVRDVQYERDGALDLEGFRVDEIEFTLEDDPNTEDYYGFRPVITYRDTFFNNCRFTDPGETMVECDTVTQVFFSESFVQSPDPTLRNGEGFGLVVSDAAFTGGTFRVRMTADNFNSGTLTLLVYHLTEDAYRYALSQDAYFEADGNPFAEPVSVHNNVEGGYGYFILSNQIEVELE